MFQSRNRETFDSNGKSQHDINLRIAEGFNLVIEKLLIPTTVTGGLQQVTEFGVSIS